MNAAGWKKWIALGIGLWLWTVLPAQHDEDHGPPTSVCADFLAELQPSPQQFTIDPRQSQHLVLKSGTEILVPARCFVDTVRGAVQPEHIHLSIIEIQNPYDLVRSNMATTSEAKMYLELGLAFHVEATGNQRPLHFGEGKAMLILLKDSLRTASLGTCSGHRGKKGKMKWSGAYYPKAHETGDLYAEEPMPSVLPPYLMKGLANPKTMRFANGDAVDYTLQHALEECPDLQTERDIRMSLTLTAAGEVDGIRISGTKKECARRALEASARQLHWDVSHWKLADSLRIHVLKRHLENLVCGSAVDPEMIEFERTENTLVHGKLLSKLQSIFKEEQVMQWLTHSYAVNRREWSAFMKYRFEPQGQISSVRLSVNALDAKVYMVLPTCSMVAEGRLQQGDQYAFHPHPMNVPAKIIALVDHPQLGPHLGILDWVTSMNDAPQVKMQPMTWEEIAQRLKAL